MGNRMKAARGVVLWVVEMNRGLRRVRVSLLVLASLVAASCGGGGDGAPPPSGPSFDLAAGIASLAASEVKETMSISGTYTGTAQLTQSIATASTFNGASAMMQTTTVSGTGMATGFANLSLLYSFVQNDSSAYATVGLDANFNSALLHAVADAPIQFPSSVKAGDTGALGTMTIYLDGAMTNGTIQVSYAVIGDPEDWLGHGGSDRHLYFVREHVPVYGAVTSDTQAELRTDRS